MEISPLMMARLLLYSFLWGGVTGAFYDACRIVRVFFGVRYANMRFGGLFEWRLPFIKKAISVGDKSDKIIGKCIRNAVIFTGDFASVLFAFGGLIVLNYAYNDGKFRFFTLAGLLVGFLIYYATAGKLVMLVSEPAAFIIKYVFCSIFLIFAFPIKKIFQIAVKNIRKLHFLYSFTLEKREKKVYNIEEKICLLEMAKNGFADKAHTVPQSVSEKSRRRRKGKDGKE